MIATFCIWANKYWASVLLDLSIESKIHGLSSPCPVSTETQTTQVNISSDEEDDIRGRIPSRRRMNTAVSEDGGSSTDPVTPSKRARLGRSQNTHGDVPKNNVAGTRSSKSGRLPTSNALSVEIVTTTKRSSTRVLRSARGASPSKLQTASLRSNRASITNPPEPVDNDYDEEEDELAVRRPTTRSRRVAQHGQPMIELDDSEESEEDIVTSPAKRRKRNVEYKAPRTPIKHSEQDQLDLAEDLEDIQDSGMFQLFHYLCPWANMVISSREGH
jgi:hypothetical protein